MQQGIDDFKKVDSLLPQVKALSYLELRVLSDVVKATMEEKSDAVRAELRERMEVISEAYGLTVLEVVGNQKRRARKATRQARSKVVRYRNPENAGETWTGKGRKPTWLRQKLEDGGELANFAIEDAPEKE